MSVIIQCKYDTVTFWCCDGHSVRYFSRSVLCIFIPRRYRCHSLQLGLIMSVVLCNRRSLWRHVCCPFQWDRQSTWPSDISWPHTSRTRQSEAVETKTWAFTSTSTDRWGQRKTLMNYCSVARCIRCYQVTVDRDSRTLLYVNRWYSGGKR